MTKPQMTLPTGDVLYEGDYGVTRDGHKVGPIKLDPGPDVFYKFICDGKYYGHNGRYWRYGEVDDIDIIAKWVDAEAVDDTPDYNDGRWHVHNGGDCPVHRLTRGDITYGDGTTYTDVALAFKDWYNPLMFRVTKPYVEPKKPREVWIVDGAHVYTDESVALQDMGDFQSKDIALFREVIV